MAGSLDAGSYQIQYKVHTASTWTAGPVIPYCTDGVSSFTDANNTVWDVRSGQIRTTTGGLTTVDPVTSSVTYLTMINGVFWQLTTNPANPGWYSGSQPGGPWTGPVQVAPITSPGVQIGSPALATGTSYDVQVRAGNIAGFGPYCTPITASTLTPGAESFAIATIPQEFVGFPFTVTGGISNALSAPTMEYRDISGTTIDAWTLFPAGSPVTQTTFSFVHPGAFVPPTGGYVPPAPFIPSGAVVANIHPNLSPWTNASFSVGQRCSTGGNAYECTNGGSSTSAPTGTGSNINNGGTATFKWLSAITFTSLQAWANTLNNTTLSASQAAVNWNNAVQTNAPGGFFMYLQGVTAGSFSVSITCAQGESFRDHPTSALSFNQVNGCAYDAPNTSTPTVSPSFYWFIDCDNVTIDGWQFRSVSTSNATQIIGVDNKNGRHFTIQNCLVDGCGQAGDVEVLYWGNTNSGGTPGIANMLNCLIIDSQNNPGAGGAGIETVKWDFGVNGVAVNCTFISRNNSQWYAIKNLGPANENQIKNCLFFGYGMPLISQNTTGSIVADHCVTSAANFTAGNTANGTTNLFSKSAAAQFISTITDFRLKTGADAIGAAAVDTTDIPTADDIFGQGRGASAWDAGAFQLNTSSGLSPIAVSGMTVSVRDANATNITATSNTFAVTTGTPTTAFTVSGGKIYRPDGVEFKAQGWSCLVENLGNMVQNAACYPLLTNVLNGVAQNGVPAAGLAPNINIVGIANQTGPGDYNTMISDIDQIVGWLTAKKVVVVIATYTNTANGVSTLSGTALSNDVDMWRQLAVHYKDNPYVWFMAGPNEGQDSTVSACHWAYYQAIRNAPTASPPGAGNTNPVGLNVYGGYRYSLLDASAGHYTSMSKVFWSFHPYAWEMGGGWPLGNVYTESVVSDCQAFLRDWVSGGTWVGSADGVIPTMAGEFGNANGNNPQAINGPTLFHVVSTYTPSICSGWIAWIWHWPFSIVDGYGDNVVYDETPPRLVANYGAVLAGDLLTVYKAA